MIISNLNRVFKARKISNKLIIIKIKIEYQIFLKGKLKKGKNYKENFKDFNKKSLLRKICHYK